MANRDFGGATEDEEDEEVSAERGGGNFMPQLILAPPTAGVACAGVGVGAPVAAEEEFEANGETDDWNGV